LQVIVSYSIHLPLMHLGNVYELGLRDQTQSADA
jgi:hypothetical protein